MRFCAILFPAIAALSACATSIQRDPVYRETEVRQSRPRLDGETFDAQEADPALREAFAAADLKAERDVGNVARDSNFIVAFWKSKQSILKKEYGIAWRTPAELNPQIRYASYGQPEVTQLERLSLRETVAQRMTPAESVRGIFRDFEGIAHVTTYDATTDTGRVYRFNGHDQVWSLIDVSEIVE
jgi:hypothetical protein